MDKEEEALRLALSIQRERTVAKLDQVLADLASVEKGTTQREAVLYGKLLILRKLAVNYPIELIGIVASEMSPVLNELIAMFRYPGESSRGPSA